MWRAALDIRRPDGRTFEIVVVAASRGAIAFRSRWHAGWTLEEVAGFAAESSGAVVNAEELLRVGETRLLPRTQGRLISSPFGRQGLLWRLYKEHFGKPGRVLVAWIDAETAFLSSAQIDACTRRAPLVLDAPDGCTCVAALDAGFRGNATTLVVAWAIRTGTDRHRVVIGGAWEWKGSKEKPLSPFTVLVEIAECVRPYGVSEIGCDGHSFDALRDLAAPLKLRLVQKGTADRDAGYAALATVIATGPEAIELAPAPQLRADLRAIKKVLTSSGFRIALPHTADGRHADFAPAMALAVLAANGRASSPAATMIAALRARMRRGPVGFDMTAASDFDRLRGLVR